MKSSANPAVSVSNTAVSVSNPAVSVSNPAAAGEINANLKPEFELFDSHAHLQDAAFAPAELPEVLARASEAGVSRILLPASSLDDTDAAAALAGQIPGLYFSAGCHPHEAADFNSEDLERLKSYLQPDHLRRDSLLAVGEIGLDYHYDFSPRDRQKQVFEQQLDLAFSADLPLIIHEREATADSLAILRSFSRVGRLRTLPGVFHCYSGSVETAQELLTMGFYLGFDGPITFKNARKPLEVIKSCPPAKLMIETDSPYLTPVPFRGKRNEPRHLRLIAGKMAELLGMSLAETAALTTENACRCFGLSAENAPRIQV